MGIENYVSKEDHELNACFLNYVSHFLLDYEIN